MDALIYKYNENKLIFGNAEIPLINVGEALVKVSYAGICGADLALVKGERKINFDVIPGHEITGIIVDIKNKNKGLTGKRVAVEPTLSCENCQMCRLNLKHVCFNLKVMGVHTNGGMAEFVKVPLNKLHLIPDSISDIKSAVVEPLAVAVHVVNRSKLVTGEKVLIVGGGPIGLLIAQVCRAAGAGEILILELNPFRMRICRNFGFNVTDSMDSINKDSKNSELYDVGYEVSGSEAGLKQIMKNIRSRGRIIIVGLFKAAFPMEMQEILYKELEILGSRVYTSEDFDLAIELISNDKVNVESLVTNIFGLKDFEKGFNLASQKEAMKILFKVGAK